MSKVAEQSQELAKRIWDACNALRGPMDASIFKDYILGAIFYRFLSEKTENYVNRDLLSNDPEWDYEKVMTVTLTHSKDELERLLEQAQNDELDDVDRDLPEVMRYMVEKWCFTHLGYVIETQFLWRSLIDKIKRAQFTVEDLEKATTRLISCTIGKESESAFKGLFDGMKLQSDNLGKDVKTRSSLISRMMLRIDDIDFGNDEAALDVLGTAYMILIGNFQDSAGKKGGEFFTPTGASVLLARLATVGLKEAESVGDCCAGSGSLMLEVQKHLSEHKVGMWYGQEYNAVTFNLLRMNMLIRGVPYEKFRLYNDDTLLHDHFYKGDKPVMLTVQTCNPPYSLRWSPNSSLLSDARYSSAGVLAPKTYADFAFVEHMVHHMADNGRIAVLLPHGVLFRGSSEYTIRKYFIKTLNCLDAVIGLPANMFHGTPIPVCVLVFKRHRNGDSDNIFFVEGSQEFVKKGKTNELSEANIEKIVDAYVKRDDIEKFSRKVSLKEIEENDFNCNISRYVDSSEEEAVIDVESEYANLLSAEAEEREIDKKLSKFYAELGLFQ